MTIILFLARITLFTLSNLGIWELLRRKVKINIYFLPSLTIAIQTTLLFIAGILNMLTITTLAIFLLGLLCLCFYLYKDVISVRGQSITPPDFTKLVGHLNPYLKSGYAYYLIVMLIMTLFVIGKRFTYYDDFSHWAVVVKQMLSTNRYPNFTDSIIHFQEYPLGSSTYIYYFSKIVGNKEPIWMLAQINMMTAAIMPLFIFSERNLVASTITISCLTNFIFIYNVSVTTLLVDTLMPLVASCALIYIHMYCVNKQNAASFYLASAYLIQIMQIKNSGIFFVLVASIYLLYISNKDKQFRDRITLIIPPFLSLFLWHRHCKYVFSNAAESTHAMTLENYSSILGSKEPQEIINTILWMGKYALTNKDVWVVVCLILLCGILIYFKNRELLHKWRNLLICSAVTYFIYQIGMLCMYIFSMPSAEVMRGADRYSKTVLVSIIYFTVALLILFLSDASSINFSYIVSCVFAVLICIAMRISLGSIRLVTQYIPDHDPALRTWLEEREKEYDIEHGSSYCVLVTPKPNRGYGLYLTKYLYNSNDVTTIFVENADDLSEINARYILIYDTDNELITSWISANYPDQYGNSVIFGEDR